MNQENKVRQPYKKSLFIFRRDLRIKDNTALINAIHSSDFVYCLFILDSNLLQSKLMYSSFSLPIDPNLLLKRRQYRKHLLRFLKEALLDLQEQFHQFSIKNDEFDKSKNNGSTLSKLILLVGDPASVINNIIQVDKEIEAIFVNRDYTPYSIKRDQLIQEICKMNNMEFIGCSDILLNEPEEILNSNNRPFKVFSQYYNKAIERLIRKENFFDIDKYKNNFISFNSKKLKSLNGLKEIKNLDKFFSLILSEQISKSNPDLTTSIVVGTRKRYQELVLELKDKLKKNNGNNEKYSLDNSSYFSAYLKFGICSIREAYSAIQKELGFNHHLIRQLYWRDFYVYIGFHFPFVFNSPFQERYRRNVIEWKNEPKEFELWCNGKTGFPIVDAGMRELNETGYMHNRLRLITASFLVKDLHIDWRYGERYFGLKLVDYDPSINNGNWQWVASTGCDAQPFFRIFNPWLQQKKFDPDCIYIKKWISELKEVPINTIHEWYKANSVIDKSTNSSSRDYPKPIVEHQKEITITRELYNI